MAQGWGVGKWGEDKWGGIATYGVTVSETDLISSIEFAATAYGEVFVLEDAVFLQVCDGTANFNLDLSESAALDVGATVVATFAKSVDESVALAETEAVAATFARAVDESVAIVDTQIGGLFYNAAVDETTAATTDEAATTSYTGLQVSETVAITALDAAAVTFVSTLIENATIAISLSAITDYHAARTETAAITDSEAIRLR